VRGPRRDPAPAAPWAARRAPVGSPARIGGGACLWGVWGLCPAASRLARPPAQARQKEARQVCSERHGQPAADGDAPALAPPPRLAKPPQHLYAHSGQRPLACAKPCGGAKLPGTRTSIVQAPASPMRPWSPIAILAINAPRGHLPHRQSPCLQHTPGRLAPCGPSSSPMVFILAGNLVTSLPAGTLSPPMRRRIVHAAKPALADAVVRRGGLGVVGLAVVHGRPCARAGLSLSPSPRQGTWDHALGMAAPQAGHGA